MFAAQAADIHGLAPVIISRKQKSVIYGAQYLHKPIPGLTPTGPPSKISTIRRGSEARYAERVYGDGQVVTSWSRVHLLADAWDLRATYNAAWEKFAPDIVDWHISPTEMQEFERTFDLVISTIPLWSICAGTHEFQSVGIMVKKNLAGVEIPAGMKGNFVIYNGRPEGIWYRASCIFGHESVEAPATTDLTPEEGWELGFKVVGSGCNCHPNVVRAGRMGKWERGVLTHNAFDTAVEAISDRLGIVLDGSAGSS